MEIKFITVVSFASADILEGLREWGVPIKVVGNDVQVKAGATTLREMRSWLASRLDTDMGSRGYVGSKCADSITRDWRA